MWLDLDNKMVAMFFLTEKRLLCNPALGVSLLHIQMHTSLLLHLLKCKIFVHTLRNKRSVQYSGTQTFHLFYITLTQKHDTDAVTAVKQCVTTVIWSIYLCALKESTAPLYFLFHFVSCSIKKPLNALNMKGTHHLSIKHNMIFHFDSQIISLVYRKISVCI